MQSAHALHSPKHRLFMRRALGERTHETVAQLPLVRLRVTGAGPGMGTAAAAATDDTAAAPAGTGPKVVTGRVPGLRVGLAGQGHGPVVAVGVPTAVAREGGREGGLMKCPPWVFPRHSTTPRAAPQAWQHAGVASGGQGRVLLRVHEVLIPHVDVPGSPWVRLGPDLHQCLLDVGEGGEYRQCGCLFPASHPLTRGACDPVGLVASTVFAGPARGSCSAFLVGAFPNP